jgi:hypothetical protein
MNTNKTNVCATLLVIVCIRSILGACTHLAPVLLRTLPFRPTSSHPALYTLYTNSTVHSLYTIPQKLSQ